MKYEKIAPGLLGAMADHDQQDVATLAARSLGAGLTGVTGNQKGPKAMVFLRCDPKADFRKLEAHGIKVNEGAGTVRTAYLPLAEVARLSNQKSVKHIGISRRLKPRLDLAGPAVRLPNFRTSTGLDGSNVVLGIIDSGIDPNHPAFAGRIHSIWDQAISGPGVPEGGFGLELTGAALAASRDTDGHGTHVAGIATGAIAPFLGVAPAAKIVIVKTDFQDAHIASGIRYIFRVASGLGLPAVVNMSLGGHFDAHDGTDDLSAVVDAETGPGKIVVCAAGNEGDENIHAAANIARNVTTEFRVGVPAGKVPILLNGWYRGGDRIAISVQSPRGGMTPVQAPILTGNPRRQFTVPGGTVVLSTPGPNPVNGAMQFEVEIHPPAAGFTAGTWRLALRGITIGAGSGRCDVWATDFEAGASAQFLSQASDDMKIGSPGAAHRAVTVGSFTTRNSWTDRSGATRTVGFPAGTISPFSSPGPLRDKRRKPDVAAPGAMIISALSADSPADPRNLVSNPKYVVEAGTSMAAPFIAGVVALLLQRSPTLTPEQVKSKLKAASRIPGRAAGAFDKDWGFGLVNVNSL